MPPEHFNYIRKLVIDQSGIIIPDGKVYQVESKLTDIIRDKGFGSLEGLVDHLSSNPVNQLHLEVVEAMTINETEFFRNKIPFETFQRKTIPYILKNRSNTKEFNIWCGASSSGQEVYSLAMVLVEAFPELDEWKVNFIASDISNEMLERCREGVYSQFEIKRGLPPHLLPRFFVRSGSKWQIVESLRNRIQFKNINLCKDWPVLPQMDVIFLRHVLIYFDDPTQQKIYEKIRKTMKEDGFLFLGIGETPQFVDSNFKQVDISQARCFQRKK